VWRKRRSSSSGNGGGRRLLGSRAPDTASSPLACPTCARAFALDERFCPHCGTPLVYAAAPAATPPESDARDRARKVKSEFARGDLVRVAGGRNQAEAELIQNLLIEEGVPSILRRSAGFDVPDFLAAGPRDVFVPESGAEAARGTLLEAELAGPQGTMARPHPLKVLAAVAAGGGVAAGVAWALIQVT
jgi:hypothetical protein